MPESNIARPQFGQPASEELEMQEGWGYKESDKIREIALELIEDHHKNLKEADIIYLLKEKPSKSNGKIIFGKAIKPGSRYKYLTKCDFIIEVAQIAFDDLNEKSLKALVDHELSHCDCLDGKFKTISHDFTGFFDNLNRHGFWSRELQNLKRRIEQLSLFEEE